MDGEELHKVVVDLNSNTVLDPNDVSDEEIEALEVEQLRANIAESTALARLHNLHAQEIEHRITHSRTLEPVELQLSAGYCSWPLGAIPGAAIAACMLVLLFTSPIHACAVGLLTIVLQMVSPSIADLVDKK